MFGEVNQTMTTRSALKAMLWELGLGEGMTVLVHTSLRALGLNRPYGAARLHGALVDVLGRAGTIVVPTQTAWNSTTSPIHLRTTAGMSAEDKRTYLACLEAFDPQKTKSSGMGAYAEYVRTLRSAVRSSHPQTSFAAVGGQAAELMAEHSLECHLGPSSPMGALYRAGARSALLGVGYEACTTFHYGEYLVGDRPMQRYQCRIAGTPGGDWTSFTDIELSARDFPQIGAAFELTGAVRTVEAGRHVPARAMAFDVRTAAHFARSWMAQPGPGEAFRAGDGGLSNNNSTLSMEAGVDEEGSPCSAAMSRPPSRILTSS